MKWSSRSTKRISRQYKFQIKTVRRIVLVSLFIILFFAVYQLQKNSNIFKKPVTSPVNEESIAVLVLLSYVRPTLIANIPPISQIDNFVSSISAQNYNLSPNGELIPGQGSSKISLLFAEKPSQEDLKKAFFLITKINNQKPILTGYLIDQTFYYAGSNLPDIIISSNLSAEELSETLQSIPSLAKIKEGIKIIDLRFNHPIIK